MQTTALEQILFWNSADPAFFWMAGAGSGDHSGSGPYRSLLSLELRGLPEQDASPFMDRRSVFLDLFHFRKSAAGNGSHGRCACAAPALWYDPVRRGVFGNRAPGACLPCGGGGLLCLVFWLA